MGYCDDEEIQAAYVQAVKVFLEDAYRPMTVGEIADAIRSWAAPGYQQNTKRSLEYVAVSLMRLEAKLLVVKIKDGWSFNPLDRLAMEAE